VKKRYREKTQGDIVTEGADMKDIGNAMHLFHQFIDAAPVEKSKPAEGAVVDKGSEFYSPERKKKHE
jgi:hypothetical protein